MASEIEKWYGSKNFNSLTGPEEDGFFMWVVTLERQSPMTNNDDWTIVQHDTREDWFKTGYYIDPPPAPGSPGGTEYIYRPIVRMILPDPPEKDMVPSRIQLYFPVNTAGAFAAGYNLGSADAEVVMLELKAEAIFSAFDEGWNRSNQDPTIFSNQMGAKYDRFDGVQEWSWKRSRDKPKTDDVGKGFSYGDKTNNEFLETDAVLVDTYYWQFDFFDAGIKNGWGGGSDIKFMILEREENESPIGAFAKFIPLWSPYNTTGPDVPYPEQAIYPNLTVPSDCVIDGATQGVARPLLYIKWTQSKAGTLDLTPPTTAKIKGVDYSDKAFNVQWKKPKESEFFDYYSVVESADLITEPEFDDTPVAQVKDLDDESVDYFSTVGIDTTDVPRRLKVFSRSLGAGAAYAGSNSVVVYKPYASDKVRIYDIDGGTGYEIGTNQYISAAGHDAYYIDNIVAGGAGGDTFVTISDENFVNKIISVGDMVILYNTSSKNSVIRKVSSISGATLNFANACVDSFATNSHVYFVKGLPEELSVLPDDGSKLTTTEFFTVDTTVPFPVGGANTLAIEDPSKFEVGDILCFMDGFWPRVAKVTAVSNIALTLNISNFGNWASYPIVAGTPYYKIRPHVLSSAGSKTPTVSVKLEDDRRSPAVNSDSSFTFVSVAPIGKISSGKKVEEVNVDVRFYGHGTIFYGNDQYVGDGTRFLYFYKNYINGLSPALPDSYAAPTNGWTKVSDLYDDFQFKDSVGIVSIATVGGGKMSVITSAGHEMEVGNIITISGTTNYNGQHTITDIASTTEFYFTHANLGPEGAGGTVTLDNGLKTVAMIAYDGSNPSTLVSTTVTIASEVQYSFYDIVQLSDFTDGYLTENIPGGRELSVTQGLDGTVSAESAVEILRDITMNGRAKTTTSTHPIAIVEAWKVAEGITGIPNDLVTLMYLEANRAILKVNTEGQTFYALMTSFGREREHGLLEQRNWNASFRILGT